MNNLERIRYYKEQYLNLRSAALEVISWQTPEPKEIEEKGKVLTLYKKNSRSVYRKTKS